MTKTKLMELRAEKVEAMQNIVETRGENMDADTLDVVKDFKEEIALIDNKLDAIAELRSVAVAAAKPVEVKMEVRENIIQKEFRNYLTGSIDKKEYEKRTNTVATHGANVVPEVFLKNLQEKILEKGNLYASTAKITTADNGEILIPTIDDTASEASWLTEGATINTADFVTGKLAMNAYKLATGISVSRELLEDSFFNIESYIANAFGERFARTIEKGILYGTGTSQMTGLMEAAGTSSQDSQNAGEIKIVDLETMVYALQSSQRAGSCFYVSDNAMLALSLEVDTTGRKLLQATAGATAADKVKHFVAGFEVKVNEELPDVATGSESVFFGNISKYLVRNVSGIRITRDDYTGMSEDEVNFYATARLDGKVISVNDSFVKLITA